MSKGNCVDPYVWDQRGHDEASMALQHVWVCVESEDLEIREVSRNGIRKLWLPLLKKSRDVLM